MKLSGRMTRSTDECEMSRSCQSATFSSAAMAVAAHAAARARRSARSRSDCACAASPTSPSGPCANGSSTSPISVFCRPRISSANFSSDAAVMASAVISSACRSRWMTCDETGAGSSPSRRQTSRLDRRAAGARTCRRRRRSCRPQTTVARAAHALERRAASSAYQSASFSPNVIGSAWTPCVRPIIGVSRCSSARSRTASASAVEVRAG